MNKDNCLERLEEIITDLQLDNTIKYLKSVDDIVLDWVRLGIVNNKCEVCPYVLVTDTKYLCSNQLFLRDYAFETNSSISLQETELYLDSLKELDN